MEKLLLRLSHRTLRSTFHAWQGHVWMRQHLQAAQDRIYAAHLRLLKKAAVEHWHQTTVMKAKMRRAVQRLVKQNLWQVFHSWQVIWHILTEFQPQVGSALSLISDREHAPLAATHCQ